MKNMRDVFVEGMDNAGKTTLVKQIASTFGLPVVVSCFDSRPKYDERIYDVYLRVKRMMDLGIQFVGDRVPLISEEVYGPLLRDTNDIHKNSFLSAEQLLDNFFDLSPLVIYCRPSTEAIMNFGDREQMGGVIKHAPTLLERYDEMIPKLEAKYPGLVLRYNWEEPGANERLMQMIRVHLTQ